jgi:hypothetical protein
MSLSGSVAFLRETKDLGSFWFYKYLLFVAPLRRCVRPMVLVLVFPKQSPFFASPRLCVKIVILRFSEKVCLSWRRGVVA